MRFPFYARLRLHPHPQNSKEQARNKQKRVIPMKCSFVYRFAIFFLISAVMFRLMGHRVMYSFFVLPWRSPSPETGSGTKILYAHFSAFLLPLSLSCQVSKLFHRSSHSNPQLFSFLHLFRQRLFVRSTKSCGQLRTMSMGRLQCSPCATITPSPPFCRTRCLSRSTTRP